MFTETQLGRGSTNEADSEVIAGSDCKFSLGDRNKNEELCDATQLERQ